jgi:hypothetical protein
LGNLQKKKIVWRKIRENKVGFTYRILYIYVYH